MPTTYAHYKFGKEVISALPRPLRSTVENHRELFDIGLHGPDILFYYHPMKRNTAKYGYIDDVIEPRNTRFRVIRALQQLQTKKLSNPAKKHGNIPL